MNYRISLGKRRAKPFNPRLYKSSRGTFEMRRVLRFNINSQYESDQQPRQINKLFGVSNKLNPHKNSARIGWKFENGGHKLFLYCYINGERKVEHLANVPEDTDVYVTLRIDEEDISALAEERKLRRVIRPASSPNKYDKGSQVVDVKLLGAAAIKNPYKPSKWMYELSPYFGGEETAPEEIKFAMYEDYPEPSVWQKWSRRMSLWPFRPIATVAGLFLIGMAAVINQYSTPAAIGYGVAVVGALVANTAINLLPRGTNEKQDLT